MQQHSMITKFKQQQQQDDDHDGLKDTIFIGDGDNRSERSSTGSGLSNQVELVIEMLRGQFGKSDQSSKPQAQRAQDERDKVLICSISNIYNGVKITPTTTTTHQKCLPSVIMSKNAINQLVHELADANPKQIIVDQQQSQQVQSTSLPTAMSRVEMRSMMICGKTMQNIQELHDKLNKDQIHVFDFIVATTQQGHQAKVLITGMPGTGKTFLASTIGKLMNSIVCAPTGKAAALHDCGFTIQSLFALGIQTTNLAQTKPMLQ